MTAHKIFNNCFVDTRDFISRLLRKPCSRVPSRSHLPVGYPDAETNPSMDVPWITTNFGICSTDCYSYSRSTRLSARKSRFVSLTTWLHFWITWQRADVLILEKPVICISNSLKFNHLCCYLYDLLPHFSQRSFRSALCSSKHTNEQPQVWNINLYSINIQNSQ